MLFKSELLAVRPLCVHVPMNPDMNLPNYFTAKASIKILKRSRRILIVDFYDRHNILTLRFFSDRKNHLSYLPDQKKWTRANLDLTLHTHRVETVVRSDSVSMEKVNRFIRAEYQTMGEAIYHIISRHSLCKTRKALEKRRRAKRNFDKMFERKYPSYLTTWYDRNVAPTYILISKLDWKKRRDATCTHCGKTFTLGREAKHQKQGECPYCHEQATYILTRYQHRIQNKHSVLICYRQKDTILLRYVEICRWFCDGMAKHSISDFGRLALEATGGLHGYVYETNFYGFHVCNKIDYHAYHQFSLPAYLYPTNLSAVFGTGFHHMNLSKIFKNYRKPVDLLWIIKNANHLSVEQLLKLGLFKMATNKKALLYSSFKEIGIPKSLLPLYRKEDMMWEEHDWLKKTGCTDRNMATRYIEMLRHMNCGIAHITETIAEIMRYVSLNRLYHYTIRCHGEGSYHFFSTYIDYLKMAALLGIDMKSRLVLFPKNLQKSHDDLQNEIRQLSDPEKEELFKKAIKRYRIPPFSEGELMVVAPESIEDFVRESAELSICVGTQSRYYENHMRGRRLIIFIRKQTAPMRPYVTMELDMESFTIIQIQGKGHSTPNKEVLKFAQKYARLISKKPDVIPYQVAA